MTSPANRAKPEACLRSKPSVSARPQDAGGGAAEGSRTLDPARMFMESLTTGPELENSQGHNRTHAPLHKPRTVVA